MSDPELTPPTGQPNPTAGESENRLSATQAGEANTWLAASMLILCLSMIAGLMLFIISKGLPAFWPKPIEFVLTSGGDFILGQRIRSDSNATLFLTGNTQTSNGAFQLVASSAFTSAGVSLPSQAALVERDGLGPAFGMPTQLVESLILSSSERRDLKSIAQLCNELLQVEGRENLRSTAITALQDYESQFRSQLLLDQLRDSHADAFQVQFDGQESWQDFASLQASWSASTEITAARCVYFRAETLDKVTVDRLKTLAAGKQRRRDLQRQQQSLKAAHRDTKSSLESFIESAGLESQASSDLFSQLDHQSSSRRNFASWERLLRSVKTQKQPATLAGSTISLLEELVVAKRRQTRNSVLRFEAAISRSLDVADSVRLLKFCQRYRTLAESSIDIAEQLQDLSLTLNASTLQLAVASRHHSTELAVDVSPEVFESLQTLDAMQAFLRPRIGWLSDNVKLAASSPATKLFVCEDLAEQRLRVLCLYRAKYLTATPSQTGTQLAEWRHQPIPLAEVTRLTYLNRLSRIEKSGHYIERWRKFFFESPHETGTLSGMFPALWGTVVLTLIMTTAVVPVGVVAALYLREYTSSGALTALIRISINNLAGVPSIIYGIFGLAFFCYTMGAFIDGGPTNADITPFEIGTWFLLAGVTAVLGSVAFFCTLSFARASASSGWKQRFTQLTLMLWILCGGLFLLLIFKSPFFEGFYNQQLPNPTFGKGGILWAALTMALLTLPIVIVCSEEALATVPILLREASSACGASKWQTIRRIVIPYALPGILTGAVLAMTRGLGQVAPLMLVGALPAVPELPLDAEFPYLHASRSFMHLGYQVYALGIQSRDTEAAQPVVFAAILVLVLAIAALNLTANHLRSRMRRRMDQQLL